MKKIDAILKLNGLRSTKVRQQILGLFIQNDVAISHRKIEETLSDIDRTTVYRTLKTFESKGLIHHAHDGGFTPKYALCERECSSHHHVHNHAHFSCESCDETICIDSIKTPRIPELKDYKVNTAELILKGLCEKCQS